MANSGDEIEVWGDGMQTRSFLYIDECIEGTPRLIRSGALTGANNSPGQSTSVPKRW